MPLTAGTRYYCAAIKNSICWDIILQHLEKQGFSGYEPIVRRSTYFGGRKVIEERPLFGAYLFVAFDMATQRWRQVNGTQGIKYLLPTTAEFPTPLPIGFVEELQMAKRPESKVAELVRIFAGNDIVRILVGAFAGQVGRVISSDQRLTRLELAAFDRKLTASVPTERLAPAD